jgi:hypothetical protein
MAFMDMFKGGRPEPPKPAEPSQPPTPTAEKAPQTEAPKKQPSPEALAQAKAAGELMFKATGHLEAAKQAPPPAAPVDTNEGMRQKAVNTDKAQVAGSPTTKGTAMTAPEGAEKGIAPKTPDAKAPDAKAPAAPPPTPPKTPNPPSRGRSR